MGFQFFFTFFPRKFCWYSNDIMTIFKTHRSASVFWRSFFATTPPAVQCQTSRGFRADPGLRNSALKGLAQLALGAVPLTGKGRDRSWVELLHSGTAAVAIGQDREKVHLWVNVWSIPLRSFKYLNIDEVFMRFQTYTVYAVGQRLTAYGEAGCFSSATHEA